MTLKTKYILLLFISWATGLQAQTDSLKLQAVVAEVLENNLDIQLVQNQVQQAENMATKGQAGYLPSVNLNAGATYSNNNTNIEFAGGIPSVEVDGAVNTGLNANLGLNYVIYNGMGRVNTYKLLQNSKKLTNMQAQMMAENMVNDAINQYLNVQQTRLNMEASKANLAISKERVQRVKAARKFGAASSLDVLAAEVDLNNDSIALAQLEVNLDKQLATLNLLMARSITSPLMLSNEVPVASNINFSAITDKAKKNNSALLMAQISKSLAQNQLGVAESGRMPSLVANLGYGVQSTQNGAGIVLAQNNNGFNGGLTFSLPVFNGKQLSTAIKNAEIDLNSSATEIKKAELTIENQVYQAELDYKLLQQTIITQQKTIQLAQTALQRAQEMYRNGAISFTDLRAAQLSLLQAKNGLIIAEINLAKLHYGLLQVSGELLN
jgi:outer membrane protein